MSISLDDYLTKKVKIKRFEEENSAIWGIRKAIIVESLESNERFKIYLKNYGWLYESLMEVSSDELSVDELNKLYSSVILTGVFDVNNQLKCFDTVNCERLKYKTYRNGSEQSNITP